MGDSKLGVFRKRFHWICLAVFLAAFYATGFLDSLINPAYRGQTNIWVYTKAVFTTKATIILFPILLVIIGIVGFAVYNKEMKSRQFDDKLDRNFQMSDKTSPYGQAHFMEPYEYVDVAQVRHLDDAKGIVVGKLNNEEDLVVDFNPKRINSHIYVSAMSGSGKTYGFVKMYIFQAVKRRHSLVITDPKGELYSDDAGYLMDNGYRVRRLDFKNLNKTDGWDCLKRLRGENMRTKVQIFANAVISNISHNDSSVFSTGSESLLQALILRVLLGHDYPEEKKNIASVYDLLQNPMGEEFLDSMFDKTTLTDEELPCLPPYMVYRQGSPNLRSNILINLGNGLGKFQDPSLCRALSTDDIDLLLPGNEPSAFFCVFPDTQDNYAFVVALFFTMFFIELVDYADTLPSKKLPVPVDFLLDEFPSIGIIPDWARKMSTVRSRGITCVMITQDFTQMEQNYKESWATILGNCGTTITLGVNEMSTAEWVSKRIGETSIRAESTSESEVAGRKSYDLYKKNSIGVGKRPLLTPAEIFEIDKDYSLILIAGRNPIHAMKTPFTIFPDAEKLRKLELEDIPDMDDAAERKFLRECEDEYIDHYWKTHSLKPYGSPDDLSDAFYTEEPTSPFGMIMLCIKEDIKDITLWFKKAFQKADATLAEVQASGKEPQVIDMRVYATAEKNAFADFVEAKRNEVTSISTETPVHAYSDDDIIDWDDIATMQSSTPTLERSSNTSVDPEPRVPEKPEILQQPSESEHKTTKKPEPVKETPPRVEPEQKPEAAPRNPQGMPDFTSYKNKKSGHTAQVSSDFGPADEGKMGAKRVIPPGGKKKTAD